VGDRRCIRVREIGGGKREEEGGGGGSDRWL
jgi:hypothetical protein